MKVVEPQSALLTTSEVHQFLAKQPPPPAQRKVGSYKPVSLKNYERVRADFQHYVATSVPYIGVLPSPETFIHAVVPKLRALGLTKTETFGLINLGVGLPRDGHRHTSAEAGPAAVNGDEEGVEEAADPEEVEQPDDRQLLALVVEELEERYPGTEGDAKIETILQTMRTEFARAQETTTPDANPTVNTEPS